MPENWNLLGHQWAVNLLKGHLVKDQPRHAYLITGPNGVGRRTLALRFAQALNAQPPPAPGDFDPQSAASQQFERMQHPDLSILRRQEGDRDLKIEAVRDLHHTLSLSPYTARYRVALLLDFEEASISAANALLKTLEEPPRRVVLLLTAQSPEALLPTITSRCEVLRLRPVPLAVVAEGLVDRWGIAADQARFLAHISGGRPGYALHLHENPDILELRKTWLDDQQELLGGGRVARFSYAKTLSKDKHHFQQTLHIWLSFWRDVLIQTAGSRTPPLNQDRLHEIRTLSKQVTLGETKIIVSAIESALSQLRGNVNLQLTAEALMLDLPYIL